MQRLETTVDKFGRVLIPKSVRNHLGFKAGIVVQLQEHKQELILKVVGETPLIDVKEGIAIFTGKAVGDLSTSIELTREERIKKFGF